MKRPDVHSFEKFVPGPYEREMGRKIVFLLKELQKASPDKEASEVVLELAESEERWTAAHAVFDFIRDRLLKVSKSEVHEFQYAFLESCCQALYNSTDPVDPFDSCSPYYVWPHALALAAQLDVPISKITQHA